MPIALERMTKLMQQAEWVTLAQHVQHAHAIGAARQTKGLGAGLVVDVIDQMHMAQHIVTHRFRRGGVACTARQNNTNANTCKQVATQTRFSKQRQP